MKRNGHSRILCALLAAALALGCLPQGAAAASAGQLETGSPDGGLVSPRVVDPVPDGAGGGSGEGVADGGLPGAAGLDAPQPAESAIRALAGRAASRAALLAADGGEQPEANWAVYSAADASLTFLYSEDAPTADTFGKAVTATYPYQGGWGTQVYQSAEAPWYGYRTAIRSVEFRDVTRPAGTAFWFYGFSSAAFTSIPTISRLDTSGATSANQMFWDCSSLASLDVSGFDTSGMTNMLGMFYGCSSLASLDVSRFDTSSVTTMRRMFSGCSSLASLDVSGFDTSNVTTMFQMFNGCSSLESLDLGSFDTSNVTTMESMFYGCSRLSSVTFDSGWKRWLDSAYLPTPPTVTGKWVNADKPGLGARTPAELYAELPGYAGAYAGTWEWEMSGLSNWAVYSAEGGSLTFLESRYEPTEATFGKAVTAAYPYSGWGTQVYQTSAAPWYGYRAAIRSVEFRDVTRPAGTAFWFCDFKNVAFTSIPTISRLDTSGATSANQMFWGCSSLASLDVSGFDTSGMTNMLGMFYGCSSLASLDVSRFDTSSVTTMRRMFSGCSSLESLDVSRFDTSNVTTMFQMFNGCSSLESLDLGSFDTSRVTTMESMFDGCSKLSSVTFGAGWTNWGDSSSALPTPSGSGFTGKWVNADKPELGAKTSAELREQLPANASAYAGTWVWEEVPQGYTVTIPKLIRYENMPAGAVSTSDAFDIVYEGSQTVTVSSAVSAVSGGVGRVVASSASASSPIVFGSSGTARDTISLSGEAKSADTWTGYVQYTCVESG